MTDYGNPRMRVTNESESAYISALFTEGHAAFTAAYQTGHMTPMEVHIDVDPADYGVTTERGTSTDGDSHLASMGLLSRADDLFSVVFDSLFSRFRAQGIYGELVVSAVGTFGEYSCRDTY